jgi:hypothetical protein
MTRLSTFSLAFAYVSLTASHFADAQAFIYLFAAGCAAIALSFLSYITND